MSSYLENLSAFSLIFLIILYNINLHVYRVGVENRWNIREKTMEENNRKKREKKVIMLLLCV